MASEVVNGGDGISSADKLLLGMYTPTENMLRDINVKVNRESVISHLDFLREVDKYQLTEGPALSRAIERYERYWLPLSEKHIWEAMTAPLDIEWVWHCHMLSPVNYERDCLTVVGKVVPHKLMNADDKKINLSKAEDMWNKLYPGVRFHVNENCGTEDLTELYVSKIRYNLVAASARQKLFYYHVSLPHYRDARFLEVSLERYRKFLYLLKTNADSFLAPTYDIDLIWHTHQLDPVKYTTNTMSILGKHLNHDDTVNDRSDGSKLSTADKLIRKIWKKEFNENFARPGAMHRGDSARGKLNDLSEAEVEDVVKRVQTGKIKITELQLDRLPTRVRIAKLELTHHKIMSRGQRDTDVELFHSINWIDEKRMIWKDSNLFSGRVDMEASHFIELKLSGISGYLIFKKNFHLGSGTLDCLSLLHKVQGDTISFEESVRLYPSPINLLVKGTISDPKAGQVTLKFQTGEFKKREATSDDRKDIWGPVPLPPPKVVQIQDEREMNGIGIPPPPPKLVYSPETCYVATHKVSYINNSPLFTCKVIHSTDLMMSAVHVYHEECLLACAHVIGPDQLPVASSVEISTNYTEDCLTLDPQYGVRAFLIKNNQGDWGVVVGRWLGIKKGVAGTKGTLLQKRKRIPGSYGYLSISFLKTANSSIRRSSTFRNRDQGFNISIGDITCAGLKVELHSNHHEGAENVALAFVIGMLHVLCQPRSPSWSPGRSPNYLLEKPTGVDLPPAEEVMLLKAAGILTYCACNRYVMDMHKMKKISGQYDTTKSQAKNNDSDDDSVGSVGGDSISLGGDSGGFNDDFMDTCGMDSCDVDCSDIGGVSVCGSGHGGGGCGGGGCGGGGSTCGGGGSACGGGGSTCGGGGSLCGGGGSTCGGGWSSSGGGGSACGGGGSSCGGGGGCGGGDD